MTGKPLQISLDVYPDELRPFLSGVNIYDSSCSQEACVIFIDKEDGYFLKSASKGALEREAVMTRYFYKKGLAAEVLLYLSDERDWLLTSKIKGDDCLKYLAYPERLCDVLAEQLAWLHGMDCSDCPIQNHTELYFARMNQNRKTGSFGQSLSTDSFGYRNAEEAWLFVEKYGHLLETDTLLHGDYCLPNVILDNWQFSGFIDLDNGGVGDRHIDIFWGIWTLWFNLKTNRHRERFIDAYGRSRVDEEKLRIVAAAEVFG